METGKQTFCNTSKKPLFDDPVHRIKITQKTDLRVTNDRIILLSTILLCFRMFTIYIVNLSKSRFGNLFLVAVHFRHKNFGWHLRKKANKTGIF